jgi:hypothetical protein
VRDARFELLLDGFDHVFRVFADPRQRNAERHLLAIARDRAKTRRGTLHHRRHVAHENPDALARRHDHVPESAGVADEPAAAHQLLLRTHVHELAAD